jgi:hypothetical protein
MEPIPSIKISSHNDYDVLSLFVKPVSRLRPPLRKVPKLPTVPEEEYDSKPCRLNLSDIPEEECDTFEPFGGNYPLSWHTLQCFLFVEQSGPFIKDNTPLSWFPPSCFPPLSYVPLSKPPKNLPPSTGINHLEDQIRCVLHYEDLIDHVQACDDEPPIRWISQQQQPQELSQAEILANRLREVFAPKDKKHKLKHFLSLPALKSRMSGNVKK